MHCLGPGLACPPTLRSTQSGAFPSTDASCFLGPAPTQPQRRLEEPAADTVPSTRGRQKAELDDADEVEDVWSQV